MVKIVHVIGGMEKGGAEAILESILEIQEPLDQSVIILSPEDENTNSLLNRGCKIECINFRQGEENNWLKRFAKLFINFIKLIRLLRKRSPDIIHTWLYQPDIIAGVIGLLLRKKVVWGIFLSNLNKKFYKRHTNVAIYLCGKLAGIIPDQIISSTRIGITNHVSIGYPEKRITFIPPGVDTNKFRADKSKRVTIRNQVGTSDMTTVVGMVARWDPQKDFPTFLGAARRLVTEYLDIEIWLAGGYGIEASNKELAKLLEENNLTSRTRYFGGIDDLSLFFNGLDIFSLMSFGEGFPLVVAQAMSCELPCVVSDVGDVDIIISRSGIVLKDQNVDNLFEAWKALIDSGKDYQQQLGRAARIQIAENYSEDRMKNLYVGTYVNLVKKNKF